MNLHKFVAVGLALFALLFAIGALHCHPLTPDDKRAIAADAIRIALCQQYGRDCKADRDGGDCFAIYDDCITDAGLRGGR